MAGQRKLPKLPTVKKGQIARHLHIKKVRGLNKPKHSPRGSLPKIDGGGS